MREGKEGKGKGKEENNPQTKSLTTAMHTHKSPGITHHELSYHSIQ